MSITGYQALRSAAAVIDFSSRGKVRATGDDRARLLHAMCTNDVENLAEDAGLYAFFLNDKGRILADAYLYNLGDALFLDLEPELAESVPEHLDRYIIADNVELENQTNSLAALGFEGPASSEAAERLGLSVNEARFGVRKQADGFTARTGASGSDGFRLFMPAADKEMWLERARQAGLPLASADDVRTVRLENAGTRYGEEIGDRYLVAETQLLHGVHFNKGCYLGQEIVERVRSRGQVHRLLTPVRIQARTAPPSGAKLMAKGAEAGEIASAVYSPALDEVVGLAYLRREAIESGASLTVGAATAEIRSLVAQ